MKILIVTLLTLVSASSRAQSPTDTTYRLEVTATASPMINFFRVPRVPGTSSKVSMGYGMSVRILWHPGRLLSLGLLSGYSVIARDEIPVHRPTANVIYSARLAAVPLQIALTMQKHGFEVGLAIGPYLMMSTISGGNSAPVYANRLELGITYFGSYFFSMSDVLQLGPELRVVSLRYRGIVAVMPSCSVRFVPLRY